MGKNFKGGMDSLLGETLKENSPKRDKENSSKRGRPKTNFKDVTKTSAVGTKAGEIRATFIVNEEQLEVVKALAYWERISIKEVLAQALAAHIASKKDELQKAVRSYKSKNSNS